MERRKLRCRACGRRVSAEGVQEHVRRCERGELSEESSGDELQARSSAFLHRFSSKSGEISYPFSLRRHTTLQCPLCLSLYSRKLRPPHVIPACGHSVCAMCLKRQCSFTCPVCGTESQQATSSLPVNFALLEATEIQGKRELCPKHEAEIVAFCRDDEVLLCGVCLFEHKGHSSFLLSSPEAAQLANTKKVQLSAYEHSLEHSKGQWQETIASLNEAGRSLGASVERHSSELRLCEGRLVKGVQSGKAACFKQLARLEAACPLTALRHSCEVTVEELQLSLNKLKTHRAHFEKLPTWKQVEASLAFRNVEIASPPDLEAIKKLEQKLRVEVDYEEALKAGKLFKE